MDYARTALPDGVLCGDGRLRRPIFLVQDSRSDSAVAASGGGHSGDRGQGRYHPVLGPCRHGEPGRHPGVRRLGCPCLSSSSLALLRLRSRRFPRDSLQVDLCLRHRSGRHRRQLSGHVGPGGDEQEGRPGVLPTARTGRVWTDETNGLSAIVTAAGYQPVLPSLYTTGERGLLATHLGVHQERLRALLWGHERRRLHRLLEAEHRAGLPAEGGHHEPGPAVSRRRWRRVGPSVRGSPRRACGIPTGHSRLDHPPVGGSSWLSDYMVRPGEQWTGGSRAVCLLRVGGGRVFADGRRGQQGGSCAGHRAHKARAPAWGLIDFTAPVDTSDAIEEQATGGQRLQGARRRSSVGEGASSRSSRAWSATNNPALRISAPVWPVIYVAV